MDPFRIGYGVDDVGRHREDKLVAGVLVIISIIAAIAAISYFESDPFPGVYSDDIDDCLSGETTPEDLGFPDASCEDIEAAWSYATKGTISCLT